MDDFTQTYASADTGQPISAVAAEELLDSDPLGVVLTSRAHAGCGGAVEAQIIGTQRQFVCRTCGAHWRDTFGTAGVIRLEAYGGAGL